jgi:hypothetical protein
MSCLYQKITRFDSFFFWEQIELIFSNVFFIESDYLLRNMTFCVLLHVNRIFTNKKYITWRCHIHERNEKKCICSYWYVFIQQRLILLWSNTYKSTKKSSFYAGTKNRSRTILPNRVIDKILKSAIFAVRIRLMHSIWQCEMCIVIHC